MRVFLFTWCVVLLITPPLVVVWAQNRMRPRVFYRFGQLSVMMLATSTAFAGAMKAAAISAIEFDKAWTNMNDTLRKTSTTLNPKDPDATD